MTKPKATLATPTKPRIALEMSWEEAVVVADVLSGLSGKDSKVTYELFIVLAELMEEHG